MCGHYLGVVSISNNPSMRGVANGVAAVNSSGYTIAQSSMLASSGVSTLSFVVSELCGKFWRIGAYDFRFSQRRANADQYVPAIYVAVVAPAAAPVQVGDVWVDTVLAKVYIATGVTVAGDWAILN